VQFVSYTIVKTNYISMR